ncbi:MAG: fasciclin domain-containing protein [Polyangiales bacterium]
MFKRIMTGALAAALLATPALAQEAMSSGNAMAKVPMVGGAPMPATKNIVENAVNSKDHTTLVSLVKKAGLVDTLAGPGPFTVFAPTNDAFAKLPKATVDAVTGDKALLTKVLTYHVVAGKMDSKAISAAIKAGNGKATLKTVEGDSFTATMDGSNVVLTDDKGGKSTVTIGDVYQSNGVIHVVDSVLVP